MQADWSCLELSLPLYCPKTRYPPLNAHAAPRDCSFNSIEYIINQQSHYLTKQPHSAPQHPPKILMTCLRLQIQLKMKNQHLIKYKNPVILKDEQGKVKMTTYDLPPSQHTYGKKIVDDPEPIKYVVNDWKEAQNSDKPPSKIKNFKELNRQAIQSNLHTAKDQTDFRKTRDLMVDAKEGQRVIPIMLPTEDFSYGVPNRPSTPMKLVMGNCYALEAEAKNETKYLGQTQKVEAKTSSKISAKTTKSQALRQQNAERQKSYRDKANLQQKFKLNKFTSLGVTKVDTGLKATQKQ